MELWVLPAVTAVFLILFFAMRNEVVRHTLRCPVKKTRAEVDVVQRSESPAKPVRVKRCSLLSGTARIDCEQACLRLLA